MKGKPALQNIDAYVQKASSPKHIRLRANGKCSPWIYISRSYLGDLLNRDQDPHAETKRCS